MPDGRVLCLVTDAAGRGWIDVLATDGSSWSEQPSPADRPAGDIAVVALDDRSLLLLVNQESCNDWGACSYVPRLLAGRLELAATSP